MIYNNHNNFNLINVGAYNRYKILEAVVKKFDLCSYDFIELAISIEDNIIKKRDIDENELNQLIITLTKFIYDDSEKNLDNKESYEFKINKVFICFCRWVFK